MQTHWRRIPQKVEVQNGPGDQELMCASRRKVYLTRARPVTEGNSGARAEAGMATAFGVRVGRGLLFSSLA